MPSSISPSSPRRFRRDSTTSTKREAAIDREPQGAFFFDWRGWLLFAVLTVVVYAPAINGQFIWDDDAYVENNVTLRTWSGLRDIWLDPFATPQYYPLVHTSYWIEYRFWGLNPRGYHVVNVLLHATSCWLLARLVRRLGLPGAALAGLLFAMHPVAVESVAWVTERKNALALVCSLLAIHAYWTIVEREEADVTPPPMISSSYGWFLLAFAGAMCSKTIAAALPAVVLVVLWWKNGAIAQRHLVRLGFALGLAAPWGMVTAWLERHHVGAIGPEFEMSPAARTLVAGRACWFYLHSLAWPYPLAFSYGRWDIDPQQAWQWLWPIAALALLIVFALGTRRWGRGPLAALLIYGGVLFPAIGFLNVYPFRYSFVADHFQYLAMPVPLTVAAVALARLAGKEDWSTSPRGFAMFAVSGVAIGTLATLTWLQCGDYRDRETLWLRTIDKAPTAWLAWGHLAAIRAEKGETEEALRFGRKAAELAPFAVEARTGLATHLLSAGRIDEARNELGNVDALIGLEGEALANDPLHQQAQLVLSCVDSREGKWQAAQDRIRRILEHQPAPVIAAYAFAALSVVEAELGEPAKATEASRRAKQVADASPVAASAVQSALNDFGRGDQDAKASLRRLQALSDAQFSRVDRATIVETMRTLVEVDKIAEAIALGERVERLGVSGPVVRMNLGVALARSGRFEQAVERFRAALQESPQDADCGANLAMALLQIGEPAEAIARLETAVAIAPERVDYARLLAWILAAHPSTETRAPERAITVAKAAFALEEEPTLLDVVAVAQAAQGKFGEALETAAVAKGLAQRRGDIALVGTLEERIRSFQARRAIVDETLPLAK